jgi:hypothetical protein
LPSPLAHRDIFALALPLIGCIHPETEPLLVSHQPHWGFPHSPVLPPREEGEEEEKWGKKKEGTPPPHCAERTGGRP